MKALFTLVMIATIAMTACSTTSEGLISQNNWEVLGSRSVNFKKDRDEIVVTRRDGLFRKIKLEVERGSINFHECIVVFGDGSRQNVNLKKTFLKGQSTRVIDLQGGRRVINRVIMVYDTKNFSGKKARIRLLGQH